MAEELTVQEAKELAKKKAILFANRWKHRRRMAYLALGAILLVTYWAMFVIPVERLNALDEILTWFFIVMGSIIGAYVGFATLDDKWKNTDGE